MSSMNIVVYTGFSDENVFKNISKNLLRCLHADKYIVYSLPPSQVLTTPWQENISLLVVFSEKIDEVVSQAFSNFVENNGNLLVFCSDLNLPKVKFMAKASCKTGSVVLNTKEHDELVLYRGKFSYHSPDAVILHSDKEGHPIIFKITSTEGTVVASEVNLALDQKIASPESGEHAKGLDESQLIIIRNILKDNFGMDTFSVEAPKLTSGYVIMEDENALSKMMEGLGINDIHVGKTPNDEKVPLIFNSKSPNLVLFDKDLYFSKLKTRSFGRVVAFFQVTTSTMILAEQLSSQEGMVVIASRQISGRGRGENTWISPEGCAMFTLNLTVSLLSPLGKRLSCLQHIATIAVVHGICKIPTYKNLDLRVKWPNDIYIGQDTKVGGVLVTSAIQGNTATINIGVGVNTNNRVPTSCICSAIEKMETKGEAAPLLSIEEVIAYALTEMEILVDKFQENKVDEFLSLYYSYWVHDNQRVRLDAIKEDVTVTGLDNFGFLIVETDSKKKLTLQPDGNRFDMMKNLIVAK